MNTETAQAIASFLIAGLEMEHQITRKVLAAVPDGKLAWRPHDKGRSAGELAWHIAHSEVWFLEGIAAGRFSKYQEPKPPESVAHIVSYYESKFPAALAKLRVLTPEALAQLIDYAGAINLPAFAYLSLTSNHSIHHRGQLSAYLRAMGEKVPSIYGSSADETWTPAAKAAS